MRRVLLRGVCLRGSCLRRVLLRGVRPRDFRPRRFRPKGVHPGRVRPSVLRRSCVMLARRRNKIKGGRVGHLPQVASGSKARRLIRGLLGNGVGLPTRRRINSAPSFPKLRIFRDLSCSWLLCRRCCTRMGTVSRFVRLMCRPGLPRFGRISGCSSTSYPSLLGLLLTCPSLSWRAGSVQNCERFIGFVRFLLPVPYEA
ncbi:hypothetical protein [Acrocarpospora macrocephala]|uniref:hypothetical protein n=1 Tax=Acrocarpospora macrocephala TaxID=150177 RepID=UPI003CD0AB6C